MKRIFLVGLLVLCSQVSAMELSQDSALTVDNAETQEASKSSRLVSTLKTIGYAGAVCLLGKDILRQAMDVKDTMARFSKHPEEARNRFGYLLRTSLRLTAEAYLAHTMLKEFKKQGSYTLWGKQD